MQPTVSIIVPCFNEEATIVSLLDAIHEQTYPRERVEVIIADGLSEDGTRAAVPVPPAAPCAGSARDR
jgi:glycosyltransferase involved in cell wall biosynthesis